MNESELSEHEFWRDRTTGEAWAVELTDGAVVGACGPLTRSELDERFFRTFDYSPAHAGWIDAHRDAYVLLEFDTEAEEPLGEP